MTMASVHRQYCHYDDNACQEPNIHAAAYDATVARRCSESSAEAQRLPCIRSRAFGPSETPARVTVAPTSSDLTKDQYLSDWAAFPGGAVGVR
jgi:hypothetical protein